MEKRNIYKIQMHMKDGKYIEIRFPNIVDFGKFLARMESDDEVADAKITANGFHPGKGNFRVDSEEY